MTTTTLCDESGTPVVSFIRGHYDLETFNECFFNEGWMSDPWPADKVHHEYWVETSDGRWKKESPTREWARPITAGYW